MWITTSEKFTIKKKTGKSQENLEISSTFRDRGIVFLLSYRPFLLKEDTFLKLIDIWLIVNIRDWLTYYYPKKLSSSLMTPVLFPVVTDSPSEVMKQRLDPWIFSKTTHWDPVLAPLPLPPPFFPLNALLFCTSPIHIWIRWISKGFCQSETSQELLVNKDSYNRRSFRPSFRKVRNHSLLLSFPLWSRLYVFNIKFKLKKQRIMFLVISQKRYCNQPDGETINKIINSFRLDVVSAVWSFSYSNLNVE